MLPVLLLPKKMKPVLILFPLLTALAGKAQHALTPSENSFEKKWVKNTSYTMAWYAMKDTARFEIGMVTTHISADKTTLTVITEVKRKNMQTTWTDSTIAIAKTLEPQRHSSYNMQRDMVLNFGKIVTGYYNDKIKNSRILISDTTNAAYFDSNIYPVLLGWLPLADGYKKDISIYDYNPAGRIGILKASVKDVTSGTYKSVKKGTRDVWILSVTDEIGGGENGTSTYYFDKADRTLWKQEINANGRKMLMLLVE